MTTTKKPRGRKCGRRPTVEGRTMDQITIRIFTDQVEWLRLSGNASELARDVIEEAMKQQREEA